MTNRIRDITVVNHRLDPHETELRILVEVENLTSTTEIKGRLMGPRSAFASTVEIAYPIREVQKAREVRVVIPEPSWWSPQVPFLYQGPLELWQDGELVERVQISHGIRTLQLTPAGLRLNGKPIVLRVKVAEPPTSEFDILCLRTQGFNTLLTKIERSGGIDLWGWADRCGMLVIGITDTSPYEFMLWKNELEKHPSTFAWAFSHDELITADLGIPSAMFYGVSSAATTFPPNASFVICHEGDPNANLATSVPKIIWTEHLVDPMPSGTSVIGWIDLHA